MRVSLMIEGQEGVTWEDWQALAGACDEHGVEALFRSDHSTATSTRSPRSGAGSRRPSRSASCR